MAAWLSGTMATKFLLTFFSIVTIASLTSGAPQDQTKKVSSLRIKRDISCRIHESACRYWCRLAGHSGGQCDAENECLCSEEDLDRYVCGGTVGHQTRHTLCAGWCQLKGKQTGDCDLDRKECVCSSETLKLRHAKCINDNVCSMWCQIKERKATGKCGGLNSWECICSSNKVVVEVEKQEEPLA